MQIISRHNEPLKYGHFFIKRPEVIIQAAREAYTDSFSDLNNFAKARKKKEAHKILESLGVFYEEDRTRILQGKADVQVDDDGLLCYVDHEVTKQVMKRIMNGKPPEI